MIKKLRLKFTLLVLGSLLVIFAGVVFAINYVSWNDVTRQAEQSLEILIENNGRRPGMMHQNQGEWPEPPWVQSEDQDDSEDDNDPHEAVDWDALTDYDDDLHWPRPFGQLDDDREFAANLSTFYTVRLDEDGNITQWSSDRQELYSDEQVRTLVDWVQDSDEDFGRIGSQFFRRKEQEDDGTLLVVLDARMQVEQASSLRRTTILVGVLAYVILGLVATLLIRRMTKPVQEAFDKQKQFVWDASHELKTPLAVILANAEVLAGEIGENEWLQYIQSEVQRTDHLVQNLLTLARMDKGSVQTVFQSFDLSQAILQVALPFESTVFEAGKTMEMDVPGGVTYRGDRDMIQQLVVILLSNAVKYSDEGGSITLALDSRGPVLKVHNTGPAIAPDVLPHIFDRFYRGDAAHNRETPGNGLGLAIAKTIVENHKGKITAESSPESGTTFTVTLS